MNSEHFIGIDIGTTGCKAAAFDADGRCDGEAYIEYPLIFDGDGVYQDAALWFELSLKAIRQAISGISAASVRGVSISSQGISFVPVNRRLEPLCRAVSWIDSSASEESAFITAKAGVKQIFEITGKRPEPVYILPKLLRLYNTMPWIVPDIYKLLTAHDFVFAGLTGECVTDSTLACGSMLYDLRRRAYSDTLIDMFGVDRSVLPEVVGSGAFAPLSETAAAATGLDAGIPVAVGMQDQKAAAFGAGLDRATATLSLGTAAAMEFLCNDAISDPDAGLPVFPYRDAYVLEAVVSTSGAALKWLRNTLFPGYGYAELDAMAEKSAPGSDGVRFYPHLSGATSPHWNMNASGAFEGLRLSTDGGDIVRSLLEGVAYQLRENLEAAARLTGETVTGIRAFGGGAASGLWQRIMCDVFALPVTAYSGTGIAAYGAAALACEAVGGALGKKYLENVRVMNPEPDAVSQYRDLYRKYTSAERLV